MYKFEEILLGNKSELLKQATQAPKPVVPIKPATGAKPNATGTLAGSGNATGINPAITWNKDTNSWGWNNYDPKTITPQQWQNAYKGAMQSLFPYANANSFETSQPGFFNRARALNQFMDNSMLGLKGQTALDVGKWWAQNRPNDIHAFRDNFFTPWLNQQVQRQRQQAAGRYNNVPSMGGAFSPQDKNEIKQRRMDNFNKSFNATAPEHRSGWFDPNFANFRIPVAEQEDFYEFLETKRPEFMAQQAQNAYQNSDAYWDNRLAQSSDPIVRANAQRRIGDRRFAANADNIMYQQAQQREQQRQWQAQRDLQDAQKAIDKYNVGDNMKGMTPQDWVAMNPLQRGEYINNYNRDQYKQRSQQVVDAFDKAQADKLKGTGSGFTDTEDYQRYADNMNRVHGKAWDARGFTPEQRDAYIQKEYLYNIERKRQVMPPKTTEGVAQTAQTAHAQTAAPQKSNPAAKPLPQIEQDMTPEQVATEEPVVKNETVDGNQVAVADLSEEDLESPDAFKLNDPVSETASDLAPVYKNDMLKPASANIMSILFPQRARDIVKEYF